MSYDMKFEGTLVFADDETLTDAHHEADMALAEDDPDLKKIWFEEGAVTTKGLEVTISIDIGAPGDWWFGLEGVVEAYADLAESGEIKSWYDGEPNESYGPDADD